jgi:hypothetical protein
MSQAACDVHHEEGEAAIGWSNMRKCGCAASWNEVLPLSKEDVGVNALMGCCYFQAEAIRRKQIVY